MNPKTEKDYKNLIRDKEIQGQIEQLKAHERLKIIGSLVIRVEHISLINQSNKE